MRKPTPAWPLFAYSRWPLCKVVKYSSGLLFLLRRSRLRTSHINLVSQNSSLISRMCSSLRRVMTLYIAIFSLLTLFRRLFLTLRFLAPPARVVLVDQSCLLGHRLFRRSYMNSNIDYRSVTITRTCSTPLSHPWLAGAV